MHVRLPRWSSSPTRDPPYMLTHCLLSVCTSPPFFCLLHTRACQRLLSEQIQEIILRLVLRCRNRGVSVSGFILLATTKMTPSGNKNGGVFCLSKKLWWVYLIWVNIKKINLLMKTFKFLIWKVKIYTLDYSFERWLLPHSCFYFYWHVNHKAFLGYTMSIRFFVYWKLHDVLFLHDVLLCAHDYIKWNE